MADDLVTIEVDGAPLQARKGAMLIEATDAAGIYVPRFCYHKKLSVAANCRMCLVEVEKAPKPLPACATPIVDGMKVKTRSKLARDAQSSTMEFLLINHPLDCPICDQGGECELQDLALGYGAGVSRYSERKRVVKDRNIGSLIQTDMTRCIHCTRCVRFGEEIAGLRELGATGRGEHMEIGTYIEHAVASELSGNVIDLCPVGALTSKPYRYSARAWELRQHAAISPHDAVGSNLHVHTKGAQVKRVVPRENDAVNETWISDCDRYGYEGLNSPERLTAPMVRDGAHWRQTDWETALDAAASGLRRVLEAHGPDAAGVLASPAATLEELHLLARLARGLGIASIDHRLRQVDFSDDAESPVAPWLGFPLADLERVDAALLVGSNLRRELPMLNHRLRKAALRGARVAAVSALEFDANYPLAAALAVPPSHLVATLAGIARALGVNAPALGGIGPTGEQEQVAAALRGAGRAVVLFGSLAARHPQAATLRWLAGEIARTVGARFGYLPQAANSVGAALAGVLPHRGAGGAPVAKPGLDARRMLELPRRGYVLLGVEPSLDCRDGAQARAALSAAEFVVAFTAFRSEDLDTTANVLLPIGLHAENPGTLVNAEGRWQFSEAAVTPPGEARPAWRILRVLGNRLDLPGFAYETLADVGAEVAAAIADRAPALDGRWRTATALPTLGSTGGVERVDTVSLYSGDALVRHAAALQASADAPDRKARLSPALAARLGLSDGDPVVLSRDGADVTVEARLDTRVPDGAVWTWGAQPAFVALGAADGGLALRKGLRP